MTANALFPTGLAISYGAWRALPPFVIIVYYKYKYMNQPPLILVVDDEENFREIFSIKLNSLGFRVETAEDGRQAIQKAKNLKPDLILMDVRMPVMDGIEAATKLKEDTTTKDIKVVFLTVLGESEADRQEIDKRLSKEIGAAGYIKKSDNLDVIIEQVKQFFPKQP